MAITSVKTGSSFTNLQKYNYFLGPNPAYDPSATFLIQRIAGTGSSGTITFSSIPSTYQHLQLRWIARDTSATASFESILIRYNGVTSTSYGYHYIEANGSTVSAAGTGFTDTSWNLGNAMARGGLTAGIMGVGIIDIHDYASTTKLKTSRAIVGGDRNAANGYIELYSSLFNSTSALSSITLTSGGSNYATTTSFALYGMKG